MLPTNRAACAPAAECNNEGINYVNGPDKAHFTLKGTMSLEFK